jgi:hypothetical protein
MLEKMISTLTLSILKSIYTLISLIFSYKLYSVATPEYLKSILLENHVCIIALTLDLQRVSFYNIIGFLYHISTTELLPFLILVKRSYLTFKTLHLYKKPLLAMWLL